MRDLIVTENITLNGVIDATEGWFAPAGNEADVDHSDAEAALAEQRDAADAILLGRVTFEEMRGYWPLQTSDTTGITNYLNAVSKYVVSSTLEDPEWEPSTILSGPLRHDITALKSQPGSDIVTTGSIQLIHELLAADLVDEIRLFVYPAVVGSGRKLFPEGFRSSCLHLVEAQSFRSGVVLLRYRLASL